MKYQVQICLLAALFFVSCSSVSYKNVNTSFNMEELKGKDFLCLDSAVSENGFLTSPVDAGVGSSMSPSLLDLDGIYARKLFDRNYRNKKNFTEKISNGICEVIKEKENLGSSDLSEEASDYFVVLKAVKFHNRVRLTSAFQIHNTETKELCAEFTVTASDDFSLGGDGRFFEAFNNLGDETIRVFSKDYKSMKKTKKKSK